MEASEIYIIIAVTALVLIVSLYLKNRNANKKPMSHLTKLGYALVFAGIFFGDERLIGYTLIGIGVLLSVIDIIRNRNKNKITR